jgi:arsenite methyltransferase
MAADLRAEVRDHYAEAARSFAAATGCGCTSEGCCGGETESSSGQGSYAGEDTALPEGVAATSLGCGNPVAVAELRTGETVLDLGSGGGLDVLLSARRVGPTGLVYGLDMTDEMLEVAQRNAEAARLTNVRFLKGFIEQIPLPESSVDVVISNCVVNLSSDKPAVLHEIARVLRPSGRVGIADIVAEDELSAEERAERGSFVGCVAGALSEDEYRRGLEGAGLVDVEVQFTHRVADRMYGAIVRARKPPTTAASASLRKRA